MSVMNSICAHIKPRVDTIERWRLKGGKARARKISAKRRSEIAKRAPTIRWLKKPNAQPVCLIKYSLHAPADRCRMQACVKIQSLNV